ncbi:flagellin, partial [Oceanospirillum sp. HFRX-1_2]
RDDAAGLQISNRLTTQVTGLNQASRNANDGISIAQIAEGALGEVTNNIQRMRQLVVQGGNRTLSSDDREALSEEFTKLMNVNNDIADRTAYGTLKILNGDSPESGFQIQSGAFAGEQDTVTTGNAELAALFGKVAEDESVAGNLSTLSTGFNAAGTVGKMIAAYAVINNVSTGVATDALFGANREGAIADLGKDGVSGVVNISALATILSVDATRASATASDIMAIANVQTTVGITGTVSEGYTDDQLNEIHSFATDTLLDAMSGLITQVDKQRAKLGAEQNGLTSTVRNNTTAVVNVSDSRARIQDTDFAAETSELTRNQIIQQASTTILSQANQLPQTALSLLR